MDETPKPTKLGTALRARRTELGLSGFEAARRAGFDRTVLHRIESGYIRQPDPRKLARLAEVLDLPVADLYSLAGYSTSSELPSFQPYLRAKYQSLPAPARAKIERYFEQIQREYGPLHGPAPGEDEQPEE